MTERSDEIIPVQVGETTRYFLTARGLEKIGRPDLAARARSDASRRLEARGWSTIPEAMREKRRRWSEILARHGLEVVDFGAWCGDVEPHGEHAEERLFPPFCAGIRRIPGFPVIEGPVGPLARPRIPPIRIRPIAYAPAFLVLASAFAAFVLDAKVLAILLLASAAAIGADIFLAARSGRADARRRNRA